MDSRLKSGSRRGRGATGEGGAGAEGSGSAAVGRVRSKACPAGRARGGGMARQRNDKGAPGYSYNKSNKLRHWSGTVLSGLGELAWSQGIRVSGCCWAARPAPMGAQAHVRAGCSLPALLLAPAAALAPLALARPRGRHSSRTGGGMPSLRHSSSYACSAVVSAFLAPSNTDSLTPAAQGGAGRRAGVSTQGGEGAAANSCEPQRPQRDHTTPCLPSTQAPRAAPPKPCCSAPSACQAGRQLPHNQICRPRLLLFPADNRCGLAHRPASSHPC